MINKNETLPEHIIQTKGTLQKNQHITPHAMPLISSLESQTNLAFDLLQVVHTPPRATPLLISYHTIVLFNTNIQLR